MVSSASPPRTLLLPSASPLSGTTLFRPHSSPRREFLKSALALSAGLLVPAWVEAANKKNGPSAQVDEGFWLRPRRLWVYRQETRESIDVVYWKDGVLQEDGYLKLCSILRDVRANEATYISVTTLDVLRGVYGYYESQNWKYPFVLTSGFRTVATNNKLSKEGAARNSMHLYGRAIDGYMPGVAVRDLAALGLWFKTGGVGMYPSRNFVHLDDARPRFWQG